MPQLPVSILPRTPPLKFVAPVISEADAQWTARIQHNHARAVQRKVRVMVVGGAVVMVALAALAVGVSAGPRRFMSGWSRSPGQQTPTPGQP